VVIDSNKIGGGCQTREKEGKSFQKPIENILLQLQTLYAHELEHYHIQLQPSHFK
jgi:hypothetical protein